MYSPSSGGIAAPTHRMSWQGFQGVGRCKLGAGAGPGVGLEAECLNLNRKPPSASRQQAKRRNDNSTNMQKKKNKILKRKGETYRGRLETGLIAFIYAYAVIWPQNHNQKEKN